MHISIPHMHIDIDIIFIVLFPAESLIRYALTFLCCLRPVLYHRRIDLSRVFLNFICFDKMRCED